MIFHLFIAPVLAKIPLLPNDLLECQTIVMRTTKDILLRPYPVGLQKTKTDVLDGLSLIKKKANGLFSGYAGFPPSTLIRQQGSFNGIAFVL